MRAIPEGDAHRDTRISPWRSGLLQAVRERIENDTYKIPPDAIAESIIEHSLSRTVFDDRSRA